MWEREHPGTLWACNGIAFTVDWGRFMQSVVTLYKKEILHAINLSQLSIYNYISICITCFRHFLAIIRYHISDILRKNAIVQSTCRN